MLILCHTVNDWLNCAPVMHWEMSLDDADFRIVIEIYLFAQELIHQLLLLGRIEAGVLVFMLFVELNFNEDFHPVFGEIRLQLKLFSHCVKMVGRDLNANKYLTNLFLVRRHMIHQKVLSFFKPNLLQLFNYNLLLSLFLTLIHQSLRCYDHVIPLLNLLHRA